MSQSGLQLLLHAGELEHILETIKRSKRAEPVGGCLFGLWRNSLIQPVIQFVTGCGSQKHRKVFDKEYTKIYADILEKNHRLLHLGFWFCGTDNEQEEAKKIVFETLKLNVLLFINVSRDGNNFEILGGKYILKKNGPPESSALFREDVLEGHSSFRLYEPLTEKIKDSKVPAKPASQTVRLNFDNLPSRVQVEEAVTSDRQWYSSDEGMTHLQLLFQYFQGAGITPEMSRDTVTQDIQFGLSGGYILDFPANFPRKMPTFLAPDGGRFQMERKSGSDVCRMVVQTVVDFLSQQSSRRRGGKH